MLVVLPKYVVSFLSPVTISFACVLAGVGLLWTRHRRSGRFVAALGAVGFLIFGASAAPKILIRLLEDRFPAQTDDPRPVSGIIVLGGGIRLSRGQAALNEAGSRIWAAARLAREHPAALVLYTGGDLDPPREPGGSEASAAAALLDLAGVTRERILLERKSLSTYENAQFTRAMIGARAGERWLLVTSAFHMPRAIGCFRAAGFEAEPYPVDFRTDGVAQDFWRPFLRFSDALTTSDVAAREWVTLVAYWFRGYVRDPFPAPNPRPRPSPAVREVPTHDPETRIRMPEMPD